MQYKTGDQVWIHLSHNELVVGEVVDPDFPDPFQEGWRITALVTEGGHPNYGQVKLFSLSEISPKGDAA